MEDNLQEQQGNSQDIEIRNPEQPEGITLNDDGELNIPDEFYGDAVGADPDEIISDEQTKASQTNYYSEEELQNTPYEQWDLTRMPEETRRYAKVIQQQWAARAQAQAAQQQYQDTQGTHAAMPHLEEPKQYTPRELAQEAQKIAIERLGIDPDEWDDYENEHAAALRIAEHELLERRSAEIANAQRMNAEYRDLGEFNNILMRQPDFKDFSQWYQNKLKEVGKTSQEVDAGLLQIAKTYGGGEVKKILYNWYQTFQSEHAAAQLQNVNKSRASKPPVLESTQGGSRSVRPSYDMRKFAKMNADEQMKAIMDMGIV